MEAELLCTTLLCREIHQLELWVPRWQPISLPRRVAHAGTRAGHSPILSLWPSPASALASAWVALPFRMAMNLVSSNLLPRAARSGRSCDQVQGSCCPPVACLVPERTSTLARGIPEPVPQIPDGQSEQWAAHTRSSHPDTHLQLHPEGPCLQALEQLSSSLSPWLPPPSAQAPEAVTFSPSLLGLSPLLLGFPGFTPISTFPGLSASTLPSLCLCLSAGLF